ncbi:LacI family DNA-binding transcriptional regulator [Kineococcus aurantiacus]|uniref:LacI family transcriptional regulator n=1 Tax=Kineococcus aurantiacus TaxID=37633 RepID=A0A7Y9J3B5_9ACTN|nr:LacI family DNA-binding transcriptional regulator [Kineococcus aurantiacus]NYD25074.1 LacI family transcriptional regulator [Kineococcus aurantiacus]
MAIDRAPTLTDVARLAGVSLTTASKAINGKPRVSDSVRARVLKVAKELSYSPNPMARSLHTGRSGFVALIIIDTLSQRWAVPALLGAESALSQIDLSLVAADARGEARRLNELARVFQARKVDGLLVLGDNNVVTPSLAGIVSVPVVYLHGDTGDTRDVVHLPDDRGGIVQVVEHLVASGRTRVAFVGGPAGVRATVERARGLQDRLDELGRPVVGGVSRCGPWSQRWGRTAADQLLQEHPDVDAIVCASDQIAFGVVQAVQASGRIVPQDVAVTGFDNWLAFATETEPALTTVDMNLADLGASAVRDLFSIIDGTSVGRGVRYHDTTLVVRGSAP